MIFTSFYHVQTGSLLTPFVSRKAQSPESWQLKADRDLEPESKVFEIWFVTCFLGEMPCKV